MDIQIFIASHKVYKFPDNPIYKPVWAGAAVNKKYNSQFDGDNTGDNISEKNPCYNELTVVYWGWKNIQADIKGLMHYRRYIGSRCKRGVELNDRILESVEIQNMLDKYDVIVPYPRRYYVMSLYKHYVNSYKPYRNALIEDMRQVRTAIERLYPSYVSAFDNVMGGTSAHMLNMFIMKGEDYDKYCKWLFDITGEVESHIADYRTDHTRLCGALSEFLLDVYIQTNKMTYVEMPLVETENISLAKRIINRLKRM